jgi:hypothetical protein
MTHRARSTAAFVALSVKVQPLALDSRKYGVLVS